MVVVYKAVTQDVEKEIVRTGKYYPLDQRRNHIPHANVAKIKSQAAAHNATHILSIRLPANQVLVSPSGGHYLSHQPIYRKNIVIEPIRVAPNVQAGIDNARSRRRAPSSASPPAPSSTSPRASSSTSPRASSSSDKPSYMRHTQSSKKKQTEDNG